METKNSITRTTELKAKDLIMDPSGEVFKINSIFGNKNNFQIYSMKNYQKDTTPLYLFISKEAMINSGWQKVEEEVTFSMTK